MRGRKPKPPHMRQRRNKPPASAAELSADTVVTQTPELPKRKGGWHPRTVAWWSKYWASPMAERLLESDVERFYMVAELVEQFWRSPSKELLAEIRRQEERFGGDPMARRRLDWNIRAEPKESVEDQPKKAAAGGREPKARPDARLSFLRSIEGGKA